jgi:hypothetical protein
MSCLSISPTTPEKSLLDGLANILDRTGQDDIMSALGYYCEACRDSVYAVLDIRLALFAAAFERLTGETKPNSTAPGMASWLGQILAPYGTVMLANACRSSVETQKGRAKEQSSWFLHQMWIKRLFERRNELLHVRPVGVYYWEDVEHAVASCLIFPLCVKIILSKRGLYVLSAKDHASAMQVDRLLDTKEWQIDGSESWRGEQWGVDCLLEMGRQF